MYLLFDIGGTNTRIAVSKDGQGFGEPRICKTPDTFEQGIKFLIENGKELLNGERVTSVAGGIAGPLNSKKTKLVNSPNLPDWIQKPLYKELFKAFGAEVYIQNDTALVGLGETHYGAGKNHKIVAYMTFSTGVGGCRYTDGFIEKSAVGFEPGHQIIENGKTLEQLVGGNKIHQRFYKDPEEISDPYFWDEITKIVAVGVHNTIVHWSPEMLVLGGGLVRDTAIKVETVKAKLKELLEIFPHPPVIEAATLGSTGGLFGAMVYAQQMEAKNGQ